MTKQMLVVILNAGMGPADSEATLQGLRHSSTKLGSHRARKLYWNAYTALISAASTLDGSSFCFMVFRVASSDSQEGEVEVIPLTKRQKGLVNGGCELMGRKLKPPEEPTSRTWMSAWSEDEAQLVWDDLMQGEPAIYISSNGVFVATRYKRVLCKGLSGMPKTIKDLDAITASLKPDDPLRSIAFAGNFPPIVNSYNLLLSGPTAIKVLPAGVGQTTATSSNDIYDYFLARRNESLVAEAGLMIAKMKTDVQKGLVPIISASSKPEAAKAFKMSLMKRCFVHDSMAKFITAVKAEGQVEVNVIKGDVADTEFGQYGMIVFEMFYRLDLSSM